METTFKLTRPDEDTIFCDLTKLAQVWELLIDMNIPSDHCIEDDELDDEVIKDCLLARDVELYESLVDDDVRYYLAKKMNYFNKATSFLEGLVEEAITDHRTTVEELDPFGGLPDEWYCEPELRKLVKTDEQFDNLIYELKDKDTCISSAVGWDNDPDYLIDSYNVPDQETDIIFSLYPELVSWSEKELEVMFTRLKEENNYYLGSSITILNTEEEIEWAKDKIVVTTSFNDTRINRYFSEEVVETAIKKVME